MSIGAVGGASNSFPGYDALATRADEAALPPPVDLPTATPRDTVSLSGAAPGSRTAEPVWPVPPVKPTTTPEGVPLTLAEINAALAAVIAADLAGPRLL